MSRITQLREVSDFLGINITITDEDKLHLFNLICNDLIIEHKYEYEIYGNNTRILIESYYIKNGITYFVFDYNSNSLYCSYTYVFHIFEIEFEMSLDKIDDFLICNLKTKFQLEIMRIFTY